MPHSYFQDSDRGAELIPWLEPYETGLREADPFGWIVWQIDEAPPTPDVVGAAVEIGYGLEIRAVPRTGHRHFSLAEVDYLLERCGAVKLTIGHPRAKFENLGAITHAGGLQFLEVDGPVWWEEDSPQVLLDLQLQRYRGPMDHGWEQLWEHPSLAEVVTDASSGIPEYVRAPLQRLYVSGLRGEQLPTFADPFRLRSFTAHTARRFDLNDLRGCEGLNELSLIHCRELVGLDVLPTLRFLDDLTIVGSRTREDLLPLAMTRAAHGYVDIQPRPEAGLAASGIAQGWVIEGANFRQQDLETSAPANLHVERSRGRLVIIVEDPFLFGAGYADAYSLEEAVMKSLRARIGPAAADSVSSDTEGSTMHLILEDSAVANVVVEILHGMAAE